jgi:biofilm PGA synthesis N-glycosyltransferase PgaC
MTFFEYTHYAGDFCFGYPFVMAWYWMLGGLIYHTMRERHEAAVDDPPKLEDYPPVSILLPCHNEEIHAEETITVLDAIDYPDFEIIAINDGSTDRTGAILDELAARVPRLRVVHLAQNQGKSTAMNMGALAARSDILVGTDGDALLDRHSLTWFVRRIESDPTIGGVTGNPRIRNRASLLGRLQVGEFSSIIGLIKRAQNIYGCLFTVSGVICAFRKRALEEAGWWAPNTITDDVDVSWRIQLAGWRLVYEPMAICWILMPETLKGLWRQRLRWSAGGTATVIASLGQMLARRRWAMLVIWLNYMASILWAYIAIIGTILWIVDAVVAELHHSLPMFSLFPRAWGTILAFTYLIQTVVSVFVDSRFEPKIWRMVFWIVWYPLVYWIVYAATAVVGLPKAILRRRDLRGTWISPDRGFR